MLVESPIPMGARSCGIEGFYALTIYKIEVHGFTANAVCVQEDITAIPFRLIRRHSVTHHSKAFRDAHRLRWVLVSDCFCEIVGHGGEGDWTTGPRPSRSGFDCRLPGHSRLSVSL